MFSDEIGNFKRETVNIVFHSVSGLAVSATSRFAGPPHVSANYMPDELAAPRAHFAGELPWIIRIARKFTC